MPPLLMLPPRCACSKAAVQSATRSVSAAPVVINHRQRSRTASNSHRCSTTVRTCRVQQRLPPLALRLRCKEVRQALHLQASCRTNQRQCTTICVQLELT